MPAFVQGKDNNMQIIDLSSYFSERTSFFFSPLCVFTIKADMFCMYLKSFEQICHWASFMKLCRSKTIKLLQQFVDKWFVEYFTHTFVQSFMNEANCIF